jgi:hypothetical protein
MIIMIIFNVSMSYFHNISFHYFEDYLMRKLIPPNFDNFGAFFSQKSFKWVALDFLFFGRQVMKIHPKETLELSMHSI